MKNNAGLICFTVLLLGVLAFMAVGLPAIAKVETKSECCCCEEQKEKLVVGIKNAVKELSATNYGEARKFLLEACRSVSEYCDDSSFIIYTDGTSELRWEDDISGDPDNWKLDCAEDITGHGVCSFKSTND